VWEYLTYGNGQFPDGESSKSLFLTSYSHAIYNSSLVYIKEAEVSIPIFVVSLTLKAIALAKDFFLRWPKAHGKGHSAWVIPNHPSNPLKASFATYKYFGLLRPRLRDFHPLGMNYLYHSRHTQNVSTIVGCCVSYKFLSSLSVWSRGTMTFSKVLHCRNTNIMRHAYATVNHHLIK